MPGSNRRFSGTLEHPPPRRDAMDRRHSNASDISLPDSNHIRQLSQENIEYIPTRCTKITAPKPAANPLQFIKVGPASLYKSAQEQLKKVEEIKKVTKEVRDEAEDWQSNLDNWKSSRRKRQEHIIERVVEVKKFEMEEYDRNRRRSKTFNEMMEERNSRGRKVSLVVFQDDDANDLSDLGISTSSGKSSISEDYGNEDHHNANDREETKGNDEQGTQRRNGVHEEDTSSSIATASSPEPEEYTYERAIQGYVNFAETRVKSRPAVTNNNSEERSTLGVNGEKLSNGHGGKTPPPTPRRPSAAKIEEKLSALEQRRRSGSSSDLHSSDVKKPTISVPKVDINKRRELFERACENNNKPVLPSRKLSGELSSPKRARDKSSEGADVKKENKITSEITSSVKERLSNLEKSTENGGSEKEIEHPKHRLSNGDVSVRERLSHIEGQTLVESEAERVQTNRLSGDLSESIKERLSNLDSACNKDNNKKVTPDRDPGFQEKLANFRSTETKAEDSEGIVNGFDSQGKDLGRPYSPEEDMVYQNKKQQFHRSLDSLDVEGSENVCNEVFERVQSLEELECCNRSRNYPASTSSTEMMAFSSQGGDTDREDREDSGIHTADVSCSVSQADEPVEDSEIITTISSVVPHLETSSNGADVLHLEVELVNHKQPLNTVPDGDVSKSGETTVGQFNVEDKNENKTGADSVVSPTSSLEMESTKEDQRDAAEVIEHQMEQVNMEKSTESHKSIISDLTVEQVPSGAKDSGNGTDEESSLVCKTSAEQSAVPPQPQNTNIQPAASPEGHTESDEVFMPASQIPPLNLSSDVEIVAGLEFPLGPPTSAEPPKEKPPPPPTELSDEEVAPVTSLKRLDSTKRIKKEIRRKRSDFLGIEGGNDDSYLEPELKVAPPPDMTSFLVEEQRSEKQLYRQSICSETDSYHGETTESRDSGVELDRAHSDDWPGKQSFTPEILSAQHSRQNSDIYGTASVTSEEDEIMKKEREIIEILEKEEQWRYRNKASAEENDIGEKLAEKLHQLEQEKMRLEWERAEEENRRQMKENARIEEEMRLKAKEEELRQQEEALHAERERLRRESEELLREKETLQLREQQRHWSSSSALPSQHWTHETSPIPQTHLSLQDISAVPTNNVTMYHVTSPVAHKSPPFNYRLSLPDLQQEQPLRPVSMVPAPRTNPNRRPQPPIPPAKPLRVVSQEQRERENSIRNSRLPSADSLPQHVEPIHHQHHHGPAPSAGQPLSRQTLQALSAVPRSRFISNDMWMQPKKKPESQRSGGREQNYNYQHWLIQEAEHRRITEQQQRNAMQPRKPPSQPPTWNTQTPPRQDKPLPDSIIQTLTQRVQNRAAMQENKTSGVSVRRRIEESPCRDPQPQQQQQQQQQQMPHPGHMPVSHPALGNGDTQEKMLSVSGKKKCSHCGEELGRGAAMIIESLRLFYHIDCFKCCVCHVQLGDGLMGTDVRVRNNKLHCHNCYSSDDGVKFSCV